MDYFYLTERNIKFYLEKSMKKSSRKRQFKQAVGALYKERLIRIEDTGIRWIG